MGVRVRLHKGVYYVFVNLAGRRKAHKVGPDRRTANAVAAAIRRKIARGQYLIPSEHRGRTFIDLAREWLERYPLTKNLRPNTWEGYRLKVEKHLIPFFGSRDVGELTPRVIEEFIAAKRAPGGSVRFPDKGLTPQYLRIVLIVLGMILQRGVRDRLIAANPIPDVNQLPRADDAAAADPFTPAELRAIVREAGHVDRNLGLELELWARSGCRAGEVAALQEHDLDARAGTALVRRTFSRGRLGPPKVQSSNRRVFVTHPTLEEVPNWRPGSTPEARALVERLRRRKVVALDPEAFVFPGRDGNPLLSGYLHRHWRRILVAADIRYREPQQLRHSWASIMLSRNAPLLYVQQQGGWSNATVLLRVYAKWMPSQADLVRDPATQAQPDRAIINRIRGIRADEEYRGYSPA
jgi:integrase